MNTFIKKIGFLYAMLGLVWCAMNLPNLLETAKFSNFKAALLAVVRIIGWPVFVIGGIKKFMSTQSTDEEK
jgi:hypothetical protein